MTATTPQVSAASSSPVFPVIFIAGLSGAGKSTVLNVFEDIRFFTMDGLPANLVFEVTDVLHKNSMAQFKGLAIGVNMLQAEAITIFNEALERLGASGIPSSILFVEANSSIIMKRYAATRRPHPLDGENLGLEQAIKTEKSRLERVREKADLVVDTSAFSIHDLRRIIQKKWQSLQERPHTLKVHLISFGFKYGTPSEADMVFDLRFLPNPYFVPELKAQSGLDAAVAGYVLHNEPGKGYLETLTAFLHYLLPLFENEGRYRLAVALGCTGGRHRSVAVTQALGNTLKENGFVVTTEHRHLELG